MREWGKISIKKFFILKNNPWWEARINCKNYWRSDFKLTLIGVFLPHLLALELSSVPLLQIGIHLDEEGLDRSVLLHHFLVVAVALLRTSCLHLLAHQHIYPQILLLAQTQLEKSWISLQKIIVPLVLIDAPIITSIYPTRTLVMLLFSLFLPRPQHQTRSLLTLTLILFFLYDALAPFSPLRGRRSWWFWMLMLRRLLNS